MGIKPDYDGLRVDPCLPAEMTDVRVTRKFRGSTYHIHILNRAGSEKGRLTLTLDGRSVEGSLLPADVMPAEHEVLPCWRNEMMKESVDLILRCLLMREAKKEV